MDFVRMSGSTESVIIGFERFAQPNTTPTEDEKQKEFLLNYRLIVMTISKIYQ